MRPCHSTRSRPSRRIRLATRRRERASGSQAGPGEAHDCGTGRHARCRCGALVYWGSLRAGVVKLADARDSKSRGVHAPCGFDSHLRHQPSLAFRRDPFLSSTSQARGGRSLTSRHAPVGLPWTAACYRAGGTFAFSSSNQSHTDRGASVHAHPSLLRELALHLRRPVRDHLQRVDLLAGAVIGLHGEDSPGIRRHPVRS